MNTFKTFETHRIQGSEIEVRDGEWQTSRKNALVARGLGSCVVVAILDAPKEVGWLGRYTGLNEPQGDSFESFVKELEDYEASPRLDFWVGSTTPIKGLADYDNNAKLAVDRTHEKWLQGQIIEALMNTGSLGQPEIHTLNPGQQLAEVILHPPLGSLSLFVQQIEPTDPARF